MSEAGSGMPNVREIFGADESDSGDHESDAEDLESEARLSPVPVREAAGVFGPKYRATRAPHGPRSFYAVVGRARAICAYPGRSVGRSGRRISPVGRCS